MIKITCNGCGETMEAVRESLPEIEFHIQPKIEGRPFKFSAEIEGHVTWRFNTTDVHMCTRCLLTGLRDGIDHAINKACVRTLE